MHDIVHDGKENEWKSEPRSGEYGANHGTQETEACDDDVHDLSAWLLGPWICRACRIVAVAGFFGSGVPLKHVVEGDDGQGEEEDGVEVRCQVLERQSMGRQAEFGFAESCPYKSHNTGYT